MAGLVQVVEDYKVNGDGVGSLGTEVTDSCKLLCGCWELNLEPLGEQQCF